MVQLEWLPQHAFDVNSLERWLSKNVSWFKGPIVSIVQFQGGQSNPTFKITANREFVLRKKPPGKLLNKAHQVDREYRVLAALAKSNVPVPQVYALCVDDSVIGTAFYIAEFLNGRILKDLSSVSDPAEQRAYFDEMARVLANLHSVDWRKAGLEGFGSEGNYYRRQLKVWSDQWKSSKVEEVPSMERLITYLGDNMQDQVRVTIVHGDYRLENLMFHPSAPRIIGVLDWEIATIGDPRADVAHCLMDIVTKNLHQSPSAGCVMSEDDFVGRYCHLSDQPAGISHFSWHFAFACFRMASIAAGVYKRALQGNASDGPRALKFKDSAKVMSEFALSQISQDKVLGKSKNASFVPENKKLLFDPKSSWFHLPTQRSAFSNETLRETGSLYPFSQRGLETLIAVNDFMNQHIFPAEEEYFRHHLEDRWSPSPVIERLKVLAKKQGLWNLFLPSESKLTNLEYARMAEVMGQVFWASEVFNCSAPDTGNMEILHLFGTPEQKSRWLAPLLAGTIRSCFAMTEPDLGSSDARNISLRISKVGSDYVLNGRKWYISGAGDPRCKLSIVMGKIEGSENAPEHMQQSMVLVPMDAPGLRIVRACGVFGQDDSPHGHMEIVYDNVKVDAKTSILWDEGKGFAIAQARLGPGRIHHCMRSIGVAERALHTMIFRASQRNVFGAPMVSRPNVRDVIAESALDIEKARLLTMQAAHMMDKLGSKGAFKHIAMIKIDAPRMSCQVLDRAIQIHGAKGVSQDTWLNFAYAGQRTLRIADGPDEVHLMTLGRFVLAGSKKLLESKL